MTPVNKIRLKAPRLKPWLKWKGLGGPNIHSLKEDLEVINLGSEEEKKEVWVGKHMPPDLKQKLLELLKEYVDVFAWSYQDMPSVDRKIVEHKLPLLPNSVPVLQQLRRMKPKVALKIKEKVEQ
ncbi:hypothetical protein CR513_28565, partial [Mucuna pruriens]